MILLFALVTVISAQQVLLPPYIDIAKGKRITATATCGEDYSPSRGDPGELFCEMDGTSGTFGTKGLSCGYCVPGDGQRDHNIRYANDGTNRWWQSPPLSRGINYKKINVTLDLEQSYHVAYVIIKTANSPRPGVWSLERSNDGGRTYTPWYHFAPSSAECKQHFGVDSNLPILKDDTVLCLTQYSTIPPFQNGEIHVSLINGRPGARDYANSKTLQEWTTATNIRLRLLEIKTLLTNLLPLSHKDPFVTRRYFYSIKDISVGGRVCNCDKRYSTGLCPDETGQCECKENYSGRYCNQCNKGYDSFPTCRRIPVQNVQNLCQCNGFADKCRQTRNGRELACNCQHNTEGARCDRCRKGYLQKKWQPRTKDNRFECQKCNCHGHSDECEYREEVEQRRHSLDINGRYQGGGVCLNCQHNTAGTNCQRCKPYYYRYRSVAISDPKVCQVCNCDKRYSTGLCADETGQCECKENYSGLYCNQCSKGYGSFPTCTRIPVQNVQNLCQCNGFADKCRQTRNGRELACNCQYNTEGARCDRCRKGYLQKKWQPRTKDNRFECQKCNCHGQSDECEYREEVEQSRRSLDIHGRYQGGGVCLNCQHNTTGTNCQRCKPYYYRNRRVPFSDPKVCQACNCDKRYSTGLCAYGTGQCECKENYSGRYCNQCNKGYDSFPACRRVSVQNQCKCNGFADECRQTRNGGELACNCQYNTEGLRCDRCREGYIQKKWQPRTKDNRFECQKCNCHGHSDECEYREEVEQSRRSLDINGRYQGGGVCLNCQHNTAGTNCQRCKPYYYRYRRVAISDPKVCQACNCDKRYSTGLCADETGQCECKENYSGRYCNQCNKGYDSFPTCSRISVQNQCQCNGFADECRQTRNGRELACNCQYNTEGLRCDRCREGYIQKKWQPRTKDNRFECQKCNCHGHSDKCEYREEVEQSRRSLDINGRYQGGGVCLNCQHNTAGTNCQRCKPYYYRYRSVAISDPKVCQACNCDKRYSTGLCADETGQCECRENYSGRYCNQCNKGYDSFPTCRRISVQNQCQCNGFADECRQTRNGRELACNCQYNTEGLRCDRCREGYIQKKWQPRTKDNRFECQKCNCHGHSDECEYREEVEQSRRSLDINGRYQGGGVCLNCQHNTAGTNCQRCKPYYYRYRRVAISDPKVCQACNCDTRYSTGLCADETGQCECKENYSGRYCNQCNKGYDSFPTCRRISVQNQCQCNGFADECRRTRNGRELACNCQYNTEGLRCDRCREGYIQKKWQPRTKDNRFECQKCNCHGHSDECEYREEVEQSRRSLDINGRYQGGGVCLNCQHNTAGTNCQRCKPYYYRYRRVAISDPKVCQACNCDKRYSTGLCADETGQCECKENYSGRYCNQCSKGYDSFPTCRRISVRNQCQCNGFSNECRQTRNSRELACNCQYNTEGLRCDRCREGYIQKKWQPRTKDNRFECQKCNCHGHSDECEYREEVEQSRRSLDINGRYQGGGVCLNCQHNTAGTNCQRCKPYFYRYRRVAITDPKVCQACNCDKRYSTGLCADETGQCECKENYSGRYCNQCNKGYDSFPTCRPKTACACSTQYGAVSSTCDTNGQCQCRRGFTGRQCEQCQQGYFKFPYCRNCACSPSGSVSSSCSSSSGRCQCKPNFAGQRCSRCAQGCFGFPNCRKCDCNTQGCRNSECNVQSGQCSCKATFSGQNCGQCLQGFYGFPNCKKLKYNHAGTITKQGERPGDCVTQTNGCICKEHVQGLECNECKPGFYNLQYLNPKGCSRR